MFPDPARLMITFLLSPMRPIKVNVFLINVHFPLPKAKIRQAARALLLKTRTPAPVNKNIDWRPWGFNEDLPLTVPLSENILPGQRVQLLSAICPEAPTTSTSASVLADGSLGSGREIIMPGLNRMSRAGSFGRGSPGRPYYSESTFGPGGILPGQRYGASQPNSKRQGHDQPGERLYENVQSFVKDPSGSSSYGWNT